MNKVYEHFMQAFNKALSKQKFKERRVGAEFKFPVVNEDGTAVEYSVIEALWKYLEERGWKPDADAVSGKVVGGRKPGAHNDTVASCETGYCKAEFSFSHVGNLNDLQKQVEEFKQEIEPFCARHNVHFLGYGIQPVTPPSKRLVMKKSRSGVWDKLSGNRHIAEEDGHDMHLFTVNSATHCHVSIEQAEAIPLVNVLNGFSGGQLALTADSPIWKGAIDPNYKCVAEMFWDLWLPEEPNRVGVPEKRFRDIEDYVETISSFRPVYVKREGHPFLLDKYETFADYYNRDEAVGIDVDGNEVKLTPQPADLDLHNTCYWYNARISGYFTVENRTNDQQPPEALLAAPALTLGLATVLPEAEEEIDGYEWRKLREARRAACESGLEGRVDGVTTEELARKMLGFARRGLEQRGHGEEVFLQPLEDRLARRRCPADEAVERFREGGIPALIASRTVCPR